MSKFLSGRIKELLLGVVGRTEDKTVLQTTGTVGIGTSNSLDYTLYVNGSTNIDGGLNVGSASTIYSDLNVGTGVTIYGNSGIVSATSFYGDGTNLTNVGGDLVEDTTPQLGGDLDLNSNDITGTGNIDINGNLNVSSVSTFVGITTNQSTLFAKQLNVSGVSTFHDDITLNNNNSFNFGNTLRRITSSGSTLELKTSGVNDVKIAANDDGATDGNVEIRTGVDGGKVYLTGTGGVGIYHTDTAKKLETTASGINVTGHTETDTLNVSGVSTFNSQIHLPDNTKIMFGESNDLQILHLPGSGNSIQGTQPLYLQTTSEIHLKEYGGSQVFGKFIKNGAVELYHSGNKKFETTGYGVTVAGIVSATSFSGSGSNLTGITAGQVGAIADIVSDTTPQLGGNLDVNSKDITGTGNVNLTGIITATNFVGGGAGITGLTANQVGAIADIVSDTTPQLGGDLSTNGNLIQFPDSGSSSANRATFGDASDLSIYHDGSHSFIDDTGTGNLKVRSNNFRVSNTDESKISATFIPAGSVALYNDDSKKFETTGIGVSVLNGTSDTATIAGPSNLIIDPGTVGDNTGIVRIKGDLFVDGTQTQINSTTIELADFVVGIATTATTDALSDGAGIEIGPDNTFKYHYNSGTNPSLKSSENLNVASGKAYQINQVEVLNATTLGSNVVSSSLTSVGTLTVLTVSGNVTANGNIVGDNATNISGINSVTATSFHGNGAGITGLTASQVGALADIVTDTTPQLGGNLDLNSNNITGTGNIEITGSLNVSGVSTFQSHVHLGDDDELRFGANNDFKIVHDPNDCRFENSNGDIKFKNTGSYFFFDEDGGQTLASFINDGGINLFYNGSKKFETTADGATVTGTATATDFNSTSDARLKTNVQLIDDPLEKVLQIKGVSFNWIENNKPSMGVIANDIEEVLPELVTDTNPKTVNYNGLIGLLIEVVKEQQTQIDSLNERLSRLE